MAILRIKTGNWHPNGSCRIHLRQTDEQIGTNTISRNAYAQDALREINIKLVALLNVAA